MSDCLLLRLLLFNFGRNVSDCVKMQYLKVIGPSLSSFPDISRFTALFQLIVCSVLTFIV
jgi:hypothetical protein